MKKKKTKVFLLLPLLLVIPAAGAVGHLVLRDNGPHNPAAWAFFLVLAGFMSGGASFLAMLIIGIFYILFKKETPHSLWVPGWKVWLAGILGPIIMIALTFLLVSEGSMLREAVIPGLNAAWFCLVAYAIFLDDTEKRG